MDELKSLESLGFNFGSPTYLFGVILFSILGWAAYRFGKKATNLTVKWLGVAQVGTLNACHCDIFERCRFSRKFSMVEKELFLTESHTGSGFRSVEHWRVIRHALELGRKTVSLYQS